MELIVILGVILLALIVGIWMTRSKPVENALEVLDNASPAVKPTPKKENKVVATTGKPKATKAKASPAKKPATKTKTTRTRKTATK